MTCRYCKLFDREKAKDKSVLALKNEAAPCLWVSEEQYPLSCEFAARPKPEAMSPDDGHGCPCFQKRG